MPEMRSSGGDAVGDLVVDIVTAIAEREGVEATAIGPPLSTVIDTDALADIVARSAAPVRVTFVYLGYEVTVDSDGVEPTVVVRKR